MTIAAVCAEGIMVSNVAFAQGSAELEEVIVTGVRGKPRTVSDSPVPVDVFSAETIESVSYGDTNDILQTLIPSYSSERSPIADGGTFIRPASLRGLPTDKTLVLVNSKRRHRASLVEIGGSGTQGPDVATIPSAAIKNVEVLRDGAAAQYGSDAIAGVINFILKDNAEGGSLTIDTGEFFEGDGENYTISGNIGFALGENGFLSISGEIADSEATSRSEQYCEPFFCLDESNPVFQDFITNPEFEDRAAFLSDPDFLAGIDSASIEDGVVQPWGLPNSESTRIFFNAGYDISDTVEAYAFGNYSDSEADGSFFYRFPLNGTTEDLRLEDGSIYNPLDIFPGGFTPRFFGEVEDYSLVSGIKGEFGSGFYYDFSARYGFSEIDYTLVNTINPSLGPDTPTSFRPGALSNEEFQLQADFVQEFDSGLVVAFGASYLDEEYDVQQGEQSSFEAGAFASSDPFGFCTDTADITDSVATAAGQAVIDNGFGLNCDDSDDAVYNVVGVGSNGFPGFSPGFSDTFTRDSYGLYLDVSQDVTDKLFLQGALRYEDYSDFGDELVGKLALQYDINDIWGFRASVGTGFRAPTPGQQGTTNVSTRLPDGFPVATGLFPAGSDVAQALGAEDLAPETSTNFTFGFTANYDSLTLTVDYYRIAIEDRTFAISTLDVSTDPDSGDDFANFQALQAAGVVGAESIGGVFYFANAFDTITEGVDIVATLPVDWSNGQTTDITASFNYNTSEFDSDPSEFLNEEDAFDFENFTPEWRGTVTATHGFGDLSLLARANFYGSYENSNNNGEVTASNPGGLTFQDYGEEVFIDLEATYRINSNLSVSLGGRNIFDEFPDEDGIGDYGNGRIYASDTIVDWQGGYYYLNLKADF